MKPYLFAAMLLCAAPLSAQSLYVGGSAGESLNNYYAGPQVDFILPFGPRVWDIDEGSDGWLAKASTVTLSDHNNVGGNAGYPIPHLYLKRFELDARDIFSPELKRGYGIGYSNDARIGGTLWTTQHFGINSDVESSRYSVTAASKNALYWFSGLMVRSANEGYPLRLKLEYVRQLHNGISQNGTETNHLNGAQVEIEMNFGRVRFTWALDAAHGLEQGNPVCDGTLGNGSQLSVPFSPCPRKGFWSGGSTVALQYRFGRFRE